jgi:predicted phage terminase large subunit-like protein
MRFINASYSADLSLEHSDYSRDILRSRKFKTYFPEIEIKQDKDTKSNFKIQLKEWDDATSSIKVKLGGNRFSTSVGGSLTGFHGHILIVDDPLNPTQAVSEVKLKVANHWMDQTLSTRKVDKANTPTILIMQRLHQDDPTGHKLAKRQVGVKHICLPGELGTYEKEVKPAELKDRYVDGLLDPTRMSRAVLFNMESELGQYGYAGQVGQKPTPPGGGMFKVDNFPYIDSLPLNINFETVVRYWDKAGTADGGAYTVGVKMIKLRNGKYIIADVKRKQWSTDERETIIKATAEADNLEDRVLTYTEQEPGSGGKESAQSTIRNLAGHVAFADRPVGDKVFRADPYSVQVNYGNVLLLRADWNHEFIEEHRYFPFSTYKDQVDASSGAFAKLSSKKLVKVLR